MRRHDFGHEFQPVDTIIGSEHPTRGLDAFTLTYLRAERQVRKIFTHLVYQSDAFGPGDGELLRQALHDAKRLAFKNFDKGIRRLSDTSLEAMVGGEYHRLAARLLEAKTVRDKLFHGQLSDKYLGTNDLFAYERDIREWCRLLGEGARLVIGYDGIGKDSHHKARRAIIVAMATKHLPDLDAYKEFLRKL